MAPLRNRRASLLTDTKNYYTSRTNVPTGAVNARTLINIRWVAVIGQLTAILIVAFALKFQLSLLLCFGIISASALLNLLFQFFTSENKRLS